MSFFTNEELKIIFAKMEETERKRAAKQKTLLRKQEVRLNPGTDKDRDWYDRQVEKDNYESDLEDKRGIR